MNNTRLIIFDLDGTLVDAYPAIISSFNYTMRKLKLPLQDGLAIRKAVGWGDGKLLEPFIRKQDAVRALSIYRKHHKSALLKKSHLFPDVTKVLDHLKSNGYKLAVASNRPTRFSMILIRHLKLKKYFNYILCADKLKHGKPWPEILNKIMKRLGLKPEATLYVGDMTIDAQAGRRAKVRTIIVTTGSSLKGEIKREKPYRIIKRVSCLPRLL
jgi:phosphoglycolate phosphatase